ncbi:hypothetical protein GCM10010460_19270 [Microbacterium terrae]|uniref:Murein DD-endopeptidase MepM n=1 Tax=Microbacterium terrae TaxID=69369 RepID=A0A0M2HCT7_9MICO|nr:Murein DD-endopeptidase MepM [Microbacterium terrae]GLJ97536.1 hypothetical protein GCM10017594_07330 [Microbacterium terrae]
MLTSQRPGAEAPEDDLAEEIDPPASDPTDATAMTRRVRDRKTASRRATPARAATTSQTRPTAVPPVRGIARVKKPLRNIVVLSMVGGLIAPVALSAFATGGAPTAEAVTLQQMAAGDAQTLVVASDATASTLERESYAATTSEEIEKKKAAEAAAQRAKELQASLAAVAKSAPVNIALTSAGSGEVRWPLLSFTKGRGLWDSGYHQGVDLLAAGGTPIYAAAAGVVRVSQESFGGYGVAVTIDHVIGGQRVSTLYGHMTYGSRQVASGQTVEAGQLIGLVGSTGSSTANHLHFEVHINGSVVDPWAWLQANAG